MAAIIKAGQVRQGPGTTGSIEFNLTDMSQNASDYLVSVKQQAAKIIRQAQQQVEDIRTEAQQSGKHAAQQAATQEAVAAAEAKWKSLEPALQKAIQSIHQLQDSWVQEWEKNAVQLAIAIAERIIRSEIKTTPEIPQTWIHEALELMANSGPVRLHLNPKDYESLGEQRETILNEFNNLAPTHIVSDPEIAAGGCRVVSNHGYVDHQLESQLQRVQEELLA